MSDSDEGFVLIRCVCYRGVCGSGFLQQAGLLRVLQGSLHPPGPAPVQPETPGRCKGVIQRKLSSSCSSTSLLERFLQDVLQPTRTNIMTPGNQIKHLYNDPRPPHADVLTVSAPLRLREEPTNQRGEGAGQERLSAPIREQHGGPASYAQTPPPVHRKAHRKTNRRKTSNSSTPPPPTGHAPPGPWQCWQQERRAGLKVDAFSSDQSDSMDQTIEQVSVSCSQVCVSCSQVCVRCSQVCVSCSQVCCHGSSDSFHFSLPVSMETQSEGWDLPVQRGLENTPVQVSREDLCRLTEAQIHLTEAHLQQHLYSARLDSALQGGEEVLPAPQHIPESFRGKSWNQIHLEDEEQVERLVRQFRGGAFLCYFDSESLARYGRRRSQIQKGGGENLEAESDPGFLPLLVGDEQVCVRRRRGFRVASRCQVVKVSRSTQTVRLVVPAVRQSEAPPPGVPAVCQSEAPPSGVPAANQEAERTPASWRCLPAEYYDILTPLQSRSSLIYLLSPAPPHTGPAPLHTGSAPRRCRKRRPQACQGSKVKYKPLPVRFYNPTSNRILKHPPPSRGPAPSCPPPPCVRQLGRGRQGNCPSK
ncbi:DBF4-type zinc finger-containing protein 2 [Dissostichus eleginoides]|uniref:DBF4-type zinc finger-containing protein 2 n=1 Tax=Dissostichus eleginoides TaxID=100907 RepID=A0AAD9B2M9_DISEL|nr:DBF4-type zinc finger-containing protein 2 [Dissostichus eleginoides]